MKTVDLGASRRLVSPHSRHGHPVAWQKDSDGIYRREGIHVPDSVRIMQQILNEGWVNAEEQDILEYWFAGTALPNTPSHIGLFTTNPADDGTGGVEVTGGSYAREAYARNGTNWGSSTAGAPSTISNLIAVTFTTATANWGTVTGWGYFTAVSAGTLLFFAALDTSKAVNSGDTAEFAIGDLTAQLGDPSDTY